MLLRRVSTLIIADDVQNNYCSLNIMLRVSFPLGRDRACRHCWISFLLDPLGKRLSCILINSFSRKPFRQYLKQASKNKIDIQYLKHISKHLGLGDLGISSLWWCLNGFFLITAKRYRKVTTKHNFQKSSNMASKPYSEIINICNCRQT